MTRNESSIICDLPVSFNHLDHSVWHAFDQTRKLIQRHPVPGLLDRFLELVYVVKLTAIGVNVAYKDAPEILHRVEVGRPRRPAECRDFLPLKPPLCVSTDMDTRVVLLVSEADGPETTHVRQQVILQHVLVVFAVHPMGDKDERRLSEGGKSGPDHDTTAAKTPLGEVTRFLP